MKRALLLTTIGTLLCIAMVQAQNVFNPADPINRYNSGSPVGSATNPDPNVMGLQKWVSVITTGVSTGSGAYDASSYKSYYINFGGGARMAFRLKFPKSYTNTDSNSKKYPVMLFFHGAGEPGCPGNGGIYNNEHQLLIGGNDFRKLVDNNKFDGFLLYPQAVVNSGCWSDWGVAPYSFYYSAIISVIDSLAKYSRLDIDRVFVDGLSNGGAAAWSMTAIYPQRVARAAPSAAATGHTNYPSFVHIPIWFATGDKDSNPTPGTASSTYNGVKNAGADIKWTLYAGMGHAVWDTHWKEAGFVPFMNDVHKANPLVYFQRYDFCPDSPINTKIGITAGFYAYEWQKDGITIATYTNGTTNIIDGSSIIDYVGNDITVKAFGTYRVRFKRTATSDWSLWSPKPAVIFPKAATQTPNIQVSGLASNVLPAPDGSTAVTLKLPEGYSGYKWYRNGTLLPGTDSTIVVGTGDYTARVTENFGCSSIPSPVFTVINANGDPKPDAAKNLVALTTSLTSIQLDWSQNPNAGQNETGFEIYRGTKAGGPYQLIKITAPDVTTYADPGLSSNTKYFYLVRAVGGFGAAPNSNEASAQTAVDNTPPTAPANFKVLTMASQYGFVKWDASTDNVGVTKYDVYVNGVKTFSTDQTSITVSNLDSNQVYSFYVKARDLAGNVSSPSNQATASTIFTTNGVNYKYFEGTWTSLPHFDFVPVVKTGFSNTFDLTPRNRSENFGFLWEGYIKVPASTTYTFKLCSNAGSNLYIGKPYATDIFIGNDGAHTSSTCRTGSIFLSKGVHPIALPYFETTGSESVSLSWSYSGQSETTVPNSVLFRRFEISGTPPAAPVNVMATGVSYNKINISWTDNSSNESGFEIVRGTSASGPFAPVATVTGTSYADSGLAPNTIYYYKVRAVGSSGESAFGSAFTEALWRVNNNGNDANGNASRNLVPNNTSYNSSQVKEGSHSLAFTGSSNPASYATVNNSSTGGFPSDGGYSQRTVALWIRPATTTNNKRVIFDFGNNTNGLGLRFNGNALQAGVASAGTRVSITSNLSGNGNWLGANQWNHVAVVYNENSLKLFLNGAEVASNNALGFTSIAAAASNNSRFGYSGGNTSDNVFNEASTTSDYFNGQMDDIQVYNGAFNATGINTIRTNSLVLSRDTTLTAPVVPAAPSALNAQLLAGNHIKLTWNDNSSDEQAFEIWRSVGNNTQFRLVDTINGASGAQKTYTDSSLFANVTYYYKVRATGIGGPSAYSAEASATTPNRQPAIHHITDFTMQFDSQYELPVGATDPDGDPLIFTASDLPYFASIVPVSNGNAKIVFAPGMGDLGAYTITVYVADGFGGKDTTYFTMVVNDNTVPALNTIADVTLNEGDVSAPINLTANDAEGNDYITWWFENMPSWATFVDNGNGQGTITLKPGYSAAGDYTMKVIVDDGFGAWTSQSFRITVNEKDPNESIQTSMMYYTGFVPLWNDIDAKNNPFNVGNLRNTKNEVTTVGINVVSGNYAAFGGGMQTGNNSGPYPDAIMSDFMYWGFNAGSNANDTVRLRVRGLDPNAKYNFVFYGSYYCQGCGANPASITTFKIGNESATVHYYHNINETDTIYQAQPNAAGEVFITMIGDPATNAGGILNALVINRQFEDGTVPVKPLDLTATALPNKGVKLTWVDKSYNESTYKVYRSQSFAGPYTLINPGAQNQDSTSYTDMTVQPFTQYYYYVAGANNVGNGTPSDTVEVTTGNNNPLITGLENILVKTDASAQDDFAVSDNPGEVLTVSIVNKPSFITLQSLGSNNYRVVAAPTIDNIGWQNLTVKVKDDKGGEATGTITVGVTDKNTRSVFINFGPAGKAAALPWNNLLGYGNPGTVMSNLKDEQNVTTPFSVTIVDNWDGVMTTGHMTGNNSGVFPDAVLEAGIYNMQNTAQRLRFNGLDNTKRYNIVIVGSMNEGVDASAVYEVGDRRDTLNARYNTNLTGNLNGLTPSGGQIEVTMTKMPSANLIFLNGIQIEEYAAALPPMGPVNLYAETKDMNSIKLSWSDRTNNENAADGFQLQRATDSLFSSPVTTNLNFNNTEYTSTGLAANTKYWFRVRAKVGSNFTDWSNRAKAITPQAIVSVNFVFSGSDAPFPWNNLSAQPNFVQSFPDLKNQYGQASGISLSIEKIFNGENVNGVNTGNNSGVVPDEVLQASYWLDRTQVATMKVSGLNQGKRYRIGFIGSIGEPGWFFGNYTATYTINGRTVYLNSWANSNKVVYIGDIVPDANGEVLIDFSTTADAVWSFNNGIIIQAYDDAAGGANPNKVADQPQPPITVVENNAASQEVTLAETKEAVGNTNITNVKAYPNPFNDQVNIDFNNKAAGNQVGIAIYNLTGQLLYTRNFGQLPVGANTLRLNTAEATPGDGIYLITLTVNGKTTHTAKLMKAQ